ncbi:MAG: hypothetical protein MI922_19330 [Bacteroidales bacterium]|nr:hypothetical protein [Bacteroidales bacterium]
MSLLTHVNVISAYININLFLAILCWKYLKHKTMINTYYLVAAIIAFFATTGHFSVGTKMYLKPVINSNIDEIPKSVMNALFHYMSVFMIISTIVLGMLAFKSSFVFQSDSDAGFVVGLSYSGFTITQIIIALNSSVKRGLLKLFQWIFWILIALFSFLGCYL